jgi:hypothetical protein
VSHLLSSTRRFVRWLDRHTVEMCRPPFPYSELNG